MSLTKATFSLIEGAPVNVLDYGAVGDGVTNDAAAFNAAAAAAGVNGSVFVPAKTYNVNDQVDILSGQTWLFDGAILQHTDDTKIILRANAISDWAILGSVTLKGTLTSAATAAETGLYITEGKRYRVEGVQAKLFKGKGIWLDGASAGALRGDRGQFTDCAAYESTVGVQIDAGAGAEYNTWSNTNISGCVTGMIMAAGNNTVVGGSIVDNTNGVQLVAGPNHCHGMFVGVNINHNTTYNLETTDVIYGHDFIGCHFYANNNSGSGAIFFNNSKGICLKNGHLDCWVYDYTGASSGYNYISEMYCPGSYGDVVCQQSGGGWPTELILSDCYGPGAYVSGVTINDPGPTYVWTRRDASSTQSLSGATTLIFPSEVFDRRGAYNTSTGVFTTPAGQAGQYAITANLYVTGTGLSATASYAEVLINGTSPRLFLFSPYSTTILTSTIAVNVYLNAGDTVTIQASVSGTSPQFGGATWQPSLAIQRIA